MSAAPPRARRPPAAAIGILLSMPVRARVLVAGFVIAAPARAVSVAVGTDSGAAAAGSTGRVAAGVLGPMREASKAARAGGVVCGVGAASPAGASGAVGAGAGAATLRPGAGAFTGALRCGALIGAGGPAGPLATGVAPTRP